MVTTDWVKFHERKDNGLVSDVFNSESRMKKLPGQLAQALIRAALLHHALGRQHRRQASAAC